MNRKCADPCPGTCGSNARCEVIYHSPICSCQTGYTGDPFSVCYEVPSKFLFDKNKTKFSKNFNDKFIVKNAHFQNKIP